MFAISEYEERIRKTKEGMYERGIEILIVSHPAKHQLSIRL